jgi:hypothetical protein
MRRHANHVAELVPKLRYPARFRQNAVFGKNRSLRAQADGRIFPHRQRAPAREGSLETVIDSNVPKLDRK